MNLVTGATGIIGSHVVLELLQQGKPVIAAKRPGSNTDALRKVFEFYGKDNLKLLEKLKWVEIELTDSFSIEEALEGISYVYHCAGYVSFDPKEHARLMKINETGTANVVNACLLKGIKALAHVSSIAAINNNDYSGELSEKVFWKTSGFESDYAISKYNAEREVWRGTEEGLPAVIVNPGVVIAPNVFGNSSGKLLHFCKKGNPFYIDGISAYVAAPDVARALCQLMDKQIYNERFIVIENNYSHKAILTLIQQAFGKKPPFIRIGKNALWVASKFLGFFSAISGMPNPLANGVSGAPDAKVYSNVKLKQTLGFEFTDLKQYIQKVCSGESS